MTELTTGNEPQWVKTPQLTKSLGSSELSRHHANIAIELEVLSKKFDRYGWDRDRSKPSQDRLVEDWITALQDFTLEEVRGACREAVENNPNKMPNEGHIKKIVLANRTRYLRFGQPVAKPVASQEAPPRVLVTQERAQAILEAAGLEAAGCRPKTFGKKND